MNIKISGLPRQGATSGRVHTAEFWARLVAMGEEDVVLLPNTAPAVGCW
jgi:hypothetical protein